MGEKEEENEKREQEKREGVGRMWGERGRERKKEERESMFSGMLL